MTASGLDIDIDINDNIDIVNQVYSALNSQAKELVKEYTRTIDTTIKDIKDNINNLSNNQIRTYALSLSLSAYDLGELKDKTNMSSEIASIIVDEAYASSYNAQVGTVAQRENSATLAISKEKATSTLFKLVASMIKTKLDEVHRIVDTLKNILISRASDRKLVEDTNNNDFPNGESPF